MIKMARKEDDAGFTLLEILVVLILISILLSLTLTFMRSSSLFLEHIQVVSREDQETFNLLNTLQRLLSSPSTIRSTATSDDQIFAGTPREVRLFARLPQGSGATDIASYRLFDGNDGRFHISWHLDRDAQSLLAAGPADDSVGFAPGLIVTFSYFGRVSNSADRRWIDTWTDGALLPELIAVQIDQRGRTNQYFIEINTVKAYCRNPANSAFQVQSCNN